MIKKILFVFALLLLIPQYSLAESAFDWSVEHTGPLPEVETIYVRQGPSTGYYDTPQPFYVSGNIEVLAGRTPAVTISTEFEQISATTSLSFRNDGVDIYYWYIKYTPKSIYEIIDYTLTLTDGVSTETTETYRVIFDQRMVHNVEYTRSKSGIVADGKDQLEITLTAFDEHFNPLPGRGLNLSSGRNNLDSGPDTITPLNGGITDQNGEVTYILSSTNEGNIIMSAEGLSGFTVLVVPIGRNDFLDELGYRNGVVQGDLIKASGPAVYYVSSKGERHPFIDSATYNSWNYNTFRTVINVSDEFLASIPLGEPVSYRPGSMITTQTTNKVYFVDKGKVLRHIVSEDIVKEIYAREWNDASDWSERVRDVEDSVLFNYTFGSDITSKHDVDQELIRNRDENFELRNKRAATPNSMILGY